MRFNCPNGWKSVMNLGVITLVDRSVQICDGICDTADKCGITDCDFYDVSAEGTHYFLKSLNWEYSLEGVMHLADAETKTVEENLNEQKNLAWQHQLRRISEEQEDDTMVFQLGPKYPKDKEEKNKE